MKYTSATRTICIAILAFLGACATPVEVLEPIPINVKREINVTSISVSYGEVGLESLTRLDQKIEEERLGDNVEIIRTSNGSAHLDHYEYLPLSEMLQSTVETLLKQSGIMGSIDVSLAISIDNLRFANAGLVWLAGDSDQLAGLVSVHDENQSVLGRFYVDIIESHAGLLGLAIRGGGVREGLAQRFGEELIKELKNLEP